MSRARTLSERIEQIRPERVVDAPPRGLARWWAVVPVLAVALLLGLRAALAVAPLDRLAPAPAEPRDPPHTTARAGALAITRGGPVVLGFQSDAPARLTVSGPGLVLPPPHDKLAVGGVLAPTLAARTERLPDGRLALARKPSRTTLIELASDGRTITRLALELRGRGLIEDRVLLAHGAAAIRFAAAGDARLVWSPVGRRGDPEYVPASSLAPAPPDAATFDDPGTARLDGAIALAILVVVVATLAALARRRLAAVSRDTWIAIAAVVTVALVARLVGLGDQGPTWDEDVNWAAGRNYVTNLLALDFSDRSWIWNYEHPPVMKVLAGIGAQLADGYGPARALSAVWSALGCALLVPIGARLFRFRVGVLAGLIAALLPPLVAHGQIVGHEAPTLLWWSLAIVLALGVHDYLPFDERRATRALIARLAWVGVAIGIAIASRFVNGLLGPVCAVIVVVQAPPHWRRATIGWGALVMPVVAIATVYAVWPRLWLHPIDHLVAAFDKLATTHPSEPFLGVFTSTPGPAYFAAYLIATAPLGVLIAAALGLARAGIDVGRAVRRRPGAWDRARAPVIVVAWLAIPLLGAMASPVRQDGVRYVMPCVLVLALIAAVGVEAVATWARRGRVFHALAPVVVGYLAVTLWRAAPYFLDYFGEHAGHAGELARARTFETAWWGEGLDRAVAYVNAHAPRGARVARTCIEPVKHLAWFREDLWPTLARGPADATWIVVYAPATRGCRLPADAREVYEVRHDGAVLAAVYVRR